MKTSAMKTRNPIDGRDLIAIPIVTASLGFGAYYATSMVMNRGKPRDAPDRKVAVPIIVGVSTAFASLAGALYIAHKAR